MKKSLLLLSLITILGLQFTYSQEIVKTEITNNLDELFINEGNPYGKIPSEVVDKYFNEVSKNLYFYEIEYNGKVIYREGIKKSIPQSRDSEIVTNMFRLKFDILLNAAEISDSDKLILLESFNNSLVDISGKKVLALSDLKIIDKDYRLDKFVALNPLENMIIKIYKIKFE